MTFMITLMGCSIFFQQMLHQASASTPTSAVPSMVATVARAAAHTADRHLPDGIAFFSQGASVLDHL